ncbi:MULTISPECIES: hypothetical protein [unclassified Pseudoalteromonas]|uniref:hypothetical protein n=1 Tax=unclassified Pseudoalteromonas TaxID=194690 RepID=UPI0025B59EA7|nr:MULTISPECIES: hypothetical protein [unclassified Pseudoalteromonas]MDN3377169.1 hypothetical protein [Pseudoalteromonas sp. APC 3893]MDN3385663.1 hypothetical protein [Pseudoalteromonas sp. APC 4017]
MAAKVKPLTTAQNTVIKELALTLVFSEIEQHVVKPSYEEATGKKYDSQHPESFTNTMLDSNPKAKALQAAIKKEHKRQHRLFKENENGN